MKKTYAKSGKTCRVTFEFPAEANAKTVSLVGEFNNWDKEANPLTQRKDGRFSGSLALETGKEYRYRFWVDGDRWENDWNGEKYMPNEFGSEDSIVAV
ncbi:MAG: glycoside hydrolase [Chloroflexi bacterium]|jgi:1,4-alpha-glucan branching enzyme|nr:glycoside hydrolase [Chloroflexota bacterium]